MFAPQIHFVCGLPRTGSTLLCNLLAQNPRHTVTATNGLLQLIAGGRDAWPHNEAFRAQGLDKVQSRIENSLRGTLGGFYAEEFAQGQVVFDKCRGWPAHIELLEVLLERKVKLITPIRDVRAIVASLEKLHRANPMIRPPMPISLRARVDLWMDPVKGIVGRPIEMIRNIFACGYADRLIIIPYRELTSEPAEIMTGLHRAIGLPPFEYTPDNVEQKIFEDDNIYRMGDLHTIRPKIEPPTNTPWEGIIPPALCQSLIERFPDINELAGTPPPLKKPQLLPLRQ